MKKLFLRVFIWFIWNSFLRDMKSVTGFKTLDIADEYAQQLEFKIRKDNNLKDDELLK